MKTIKTMLLTAFIAVLFSGCGGTAAILSTPIENIEMNKPYRVVGRVYINGGIFVPIKIENELIYLKGYVRPINKNNVKFYLVD